MGCARAPIYPIEHTRARTNQILRLVIDLCLIRARPADELLEQEYNVDRLLARRKAAGGGFEYLTAWEEYGTEGDT